MKNEVSEIICDDKDTLLHYKYMFSLFADRVKELCEMGRDDIVYGFKLGELYSDLKRKEFEMSDFISNLKVK